jgi:hypothetical protein
VTPTTNPAYRAGVAKVGMTLEEALAIMGEPDKIQKHRHFKDGDLAYSCIIF